MICEMGSDEDWLTELEEAARARGLTLWKAAVKAEIAPTTVQRWRNRETSPRMATIHKLRAVIRQHGAESAQEGRPRVRRLAGSTGGAGA